MGSDPRSFDDVDNGDLKMEDAGIIQFSKQTEVETAQKPVSE